MRMFWLFGPKAKYPSLGWWENFMGGHINIGRHITIFGANAMNWAMVIHTKKYGYIHIDLPSIRRHKMGWQSCIYCSPDGTPDSSTYYKILNRTYPVREGGYEPKSTMAKLRRLRFGHNFDSFNNQEARNIRDKLSVTDAIKLIKILENLNSEYNREDILAVYDYLPINLKEKYKFEVRSQNSGLWDFSFQI